MMDYGLSFLMLNREDLLFSFSLIFMIFLGLGLDLDYYVCLSLFVILVSNEGFGLINIHAMYMFFMVYFISSIYSWYW